MKEFNIYITGVGGQGIGLLSEAILRGIDHAGIRAIAVDTHGLAQRGGVVVSRIRCGKNVYSPLTMNGRSDLVLGMEVNEAMRGLQSALKQSGTLVYLNVSWQPLGVRLGKSAEISARDIEIVAEKKDGQLIVIEPDDIPDVRMQNMALLGTLAGCRLIPGVMKDHYAMALDDLLSGEMLKKNLELFKIFAGQA